MTNYTTLGGRIECTQCNALSKRSRQRCQAPAIKGKTKCRFHGGKSTGPKTTDSYNANTCPEVSLRGKGYLHPTFYKLWP